MLIKSGVYSLGMESSITTRKQELDSKVGTIVLNVHDYSVIQNVVSSVEGGTTFTSEQIEFVYISEMRVCIKFRDNLEYNFPIGDTLQ
jgi:hypothetical protein